MCGIVGCIGADNVADILIDSLGRLEYRGYDSAGVALICGENINIVKSQGRIVRLKEMMPRLESEVGIGHTRWATHGKPSDRNAHPHADCTGRIAVIHNGIIENYNELKDSLLAGGHRFASETDTEVIAHLLEDSYNGDMTEALRRTVRKLHGSFALAAINKDEPDRIFAARKDSPMVIGIGVGRYFLASDVTAFLKYTRSAIFLEDGDMAVLSREGVDIMDFDGIRVEREVRTIEWDIEAAEKSGYEHFMLKEIHEQSRSIKDAISGRLDELAGEAVLKDAGMTKNEVAAIKRAVIIACGTSYHAGIMGKYALETFTDIPVSVEIGSEFRYSSNRIGPDTLVIAISQSGETADTIAAVKDAMRKGARVIAVTNVVGSTISREADHTIYMRSGPEIGVAATKTFTSQAVVMYLLALYLGRMRGTMSLEQARSLISELKLLPQRAGNVLEQDAPVIEVAKAFSGSSSFFFVGRNLNYPIALEGALKLKEISYIYAEGYAAGELKHGPLALLTIGVPVVAVVTRSPTYDKMVSNIKEIKAREASVIAVASESDHNIDGVADIVLRVPDACEYTSPILAAIVLQLLAYYVAVSRGCPIDKPRNLAKSVTVE